jgi:hypothetical protein
MVCVFEQDLWKIVQSVFEVRVESDDIKVRKLHWAVNNTKSIEPFRRKKVQRYNRDKLKRLYKVKII